MYSSSPSIETAPSVNDARDIARQFAESDVSNLAQRYDLGRGQQQQQPPAGGNQQQSQTQQQSQQTGGTITQAMVNSQQYQSAVNPPSTAQPMSKLARRGALVNYLTSQGISQQDAVAHAQQAIQ